RAGIAWRNLSKCGLFPIRRIGRHLLAQTAGTPQDAGRGEIAKSGQSRADRTCATSRKSRTSAPAVEQVSNLLGMSIIPAANAFQVMGEEIITQRRQGAKHSIDSRSPCATMIIPSLPGDRRPAFNWHWRLPY